MEPEDINIDDWERILLGLVPPVFLIEVIFRILFIYLILIISVRLLGNRLASNMGRLELVTRICLASAMGIPLQSPQNGLLPGVVVAVVAVASARIISFYSSRYRKFEIFTQEDITVLVEDSVMHLKNMDSTFIARERLLAQLRSSQHQSFGRSQAIIH